MNTDQNMSQPFSDDIFTEFEALLNQLKYANATYTRSKSNKTKDSIVSNIAL